MKMPDDNTKQAANEELENELRNIPSPSAPSHLLEQLLADIPDQKKKTSKVERGSLYSIMLRAAAAVFLLVSVYSFSRLLISKPPRPWTLASTAPEYIICPIFAGDDYSCINPETILPASSPEDQSL